MKINFTKAAAVFLKEKNMIVIDDRIPGVLHIRGSKRITNPYTAIFRAISYKSCGGACINISKEIQEQIGVHLGKQQLLEVIPETYGWLTLKPVQEREEGKVYVCVS